MKKIGLISDTHGFLDQAVFDHFNPCDEVWHAGDVGSVEVLDQLEAFRPLRVVYGNIDGREVRQRTVENLHFELEGCRIWMTHIGGAPPRYNPEVGPSLRIAPPDLFVCGHSHILRVLRDPALNNMLYVNPGAAGREGFHTMRTILRFALEAGRVKDMEVIELGKRGALS